MTVAVRPDELLRELAPQVLGALVRRYGSFDLCEDAVQEALLAAALKWPREGTPDTPRGWLITVAARRLVDQIRADQARRNREARLALATPQSELLAWAADARPAGDRDDSLALLFLCCHPDLSAAGRIALTLRAVGGLTTAQIAAAFLVPEATMAQRITRAKRVVRPGFPEPADPGEYHRRLGEVLHVLYLIFNEGYTSTSSPELTTPALSTEAIRLTRLLHRLLPDDCEVAGLLALMLLTDARRPARVGPHGELVPLPDQDRSLWDRQLIADGTELLARTLRRGAVGPYQLQAAIAAVHDEAASAEATDWRQVLALYGLLEQVAPSAVVTLNRAVALAMVDGPAAGLDLLTALAAADPRMARHHRLPATRAHLLELLGDRAAAAEAYGEAARRTGSEPERRHLLALMERASGGPPQS